MSDQTVYYDLLLDWRLGPGEKAPRLFFQGSRAQLQRMLGALTLAAVGCMSSTLDDAVGDMMQAQGIPCVAARTANHG